TPIPTTKDVPSPPRRRRRAALHWNYLRLLALSSPPHALDGFEELVGLDRLGDVPGEPRIETALAGVGAPVSAQGDGGHRPAAAQLAHQRMTVAIRQRNVADDDFGLVRQPEPLFDRSRDRDLVAV